ncbi:MAG: cation transporting ATPase C-terminal domain-containing protein, partial [Armatimonadetes bacterium]|nr:cation transporting ATPase C-terminal domain-containing protein [Armatimonadota bacterium]
VPLLGWPLLLLPITILWLELLIHPTVALVFQAQPPAADLMDRPPRDPRAPLLTAGEWAGVVATGTAIAFGALALYGMELARGVAGREARAIATAALVLADILLTALLLSETGTRALGRNRFFWLTGAAAFGLLLVAVYTPPVTAVTGLARLRPHDWLESLVTAMLTVFGWEAVRRLGAGRRRRERRFA